MKKLLLLFAFLTLSVGLWAETQTVPYRYPVYNIDGDATSGVKEWRDGSAEAIRITGPESVLGKAGTETWYYVDCLEFTEIKTDSISITIKNGLDIKGTVHLILCDMPSDRQILTIGTPNTNRPGINTEGATLVIYGQKSGSGRLAAYGGEEASGDYYNGSPGIGSCPTTSDDDIPAPGGTVIINGGFVMATGGNGGAGIGGAGSTDGTGGMGGTVIINGGTVTALGKGVKSSGIGAGGSNGIGAKLTINGGTVTAEGANAMSVDIGGPGIDENEYALTTVTGGALNASVIVDKVAISGGIFAQKPQDEWLMYGCSVISNEDAATKAEYPWAIERDETWKTVTYGENITVSPTFTSGTELPFGTKITFTAADRTADGYDFIGFYKESTFATPITTGVSGQTYTVTVTDSPISVYAKYKNNRVSTTYIDEKGESHNVEANETGGMTNDPVTWGETGKTTWYVVTSKDARILGGVICQGDVNLILADGANLIANLSSNKRKAGIQVSGDGNSLTIYGQTNQTGTLKAYGGENAAGIGGVIEGDGSNITINGGIVGASGGKNAAGIGGGAGTSGSNITINGGKVTAYGGMYGAGIGGGSSNPGSNITITGGRVTAYGGQYAAGIGGGYYGHGSNISITGGTVTANGEEGADGIGNGKDPMKVSSNITVATTLQVKAGVSENPTDVISNTGSDLAGSLAGKQYATIKVPVASEPVNAAYIDENGEAQTADAWGVESSDSPVTLGEATVTKWYVITGEVYLDNAICQGDVRLILADGAKLMATGNDTIKTPGIQVSGEGNCLTIYGQTNQTGKIIANGGEYAAGIGGGNEADGSNITINGGIIVSNGGNFAAGIGGGSKGSGSDITVNGGTITASGGSSGAGIGGGWNGSGSNITVATTLQVKASGKNPPTSVIENTGSDLASSLAGKRYVTMTDAVCNITANQDPDHENNYYSTFYSSTKAYKVPEGVTAYTGVVDGNVLNLTSITDGIIPAGKGVILRLTTEDNTATKHEIALTATTETGTWSGTNALTGTDVKKTLGANDYALSLGQSGVGFYLWQGKTIDAHKAYLSLEDNEEGNAKAFTFRFDDEETDAIHGLTTALSEGEGAIYNLNGVRVNDSYKGIVIKNGKKLYQR